MWFQTKGEAVGIYRRSREGTRGGKGGDQETEEWVWPSSS